MLMNPNKDLTYGGRLLTMLMKRIPVLIAMWFSLCALNPARLFAEEIKTTSKLTEVTVYRSMARESRTASANVPSGQFEVIISDISTSMVDNSLLVGVKGAATLLSASVRMNYFQDEVKKDHPDVRRYQDSIKVIGREILWVQSQMEILTEEEQLLKDNRKLGTEHEAMKPSDLTVLVELYRTRMTDIRKKMLALGQKLEDLNERNAKFSNQLAELGNKSKAPVKEIVLSLSAENPAAISLKINYLVSSAGWNPLYDLRVINTNQPVNLDYKAKIFQNTGSDWKDVILSVSTANPSRDNNRPIMSPKFIDYIAYIPRKTKDVSTATQFLSNAPAMNMMQLDSKKMVEADGESYNPVLPYEVDVEDNGLNVEFKIQTNQKIKSDGKEHVCMIQTHKVPATFRYHAVPKLDPSAFLLARITDYGKYNLIKGQANVFFEDMYVGQVLLNPESVSDTLLVSLGRDENIQIKRVKLVDKNSRKFLGDTQKDETAWEILVRNNKSAPIEIEVLDQIPLSKRKEIVVSLEEKSGAQYDEEYGKILWNLTIKPGDSKKLKLRYTVEYPKGQQVQEF